MKEQSHENYYRYLREEKKYSDHTAGNCLRTLKKYHDFIQSENISETEITYTDILKLIKQLKEEDRTSAYINLALRHLDVYYTFLKKIKRAEHNPFLNFRIKGEKRRLPHDILSKSYLENLYENCKAGTPGEKRNKAMLGLMIFQGLRREELENLEPQEINLYKGTVYIKGHGKVKARTLELHSKQIMLLDEYIRETRPELLKIREKRTKITKTNHRLFIGTGSNEKAREALEFFIKTLQENHTHLKHITQIRTSVIMHWLKEKKIREVQYLAGHSHIYSTEVYKQADKEELKQQLDKYHPLR